MSNIKDISGRPYIDLASFVDVTPFDNLKPEICRGISTAQHLAVNGLQTINPGSINPESQGYRVKPLYEMYSLWEGLPESDPLKIAGTGLNYNQLSKYLKFAFGAYDLYSIYKILDADFQHDDLGETASHFPNLTDWILSFKTSGIFTGLHSASLFVLEAGGIPWEHYDPEVVDDEKNILSEFIHIKTDLDRPFYLLDSITKDRTYMNTRVAWWNEGNWHGGDPISRPTYTLRINGKFTDEFKNRILS